MWNTCPDHTTLNTLNRPSQGPSSPTFFFVLSLKLSSFEAFLRGGLVGTWLFFPPSCSHMAFTQQGVNRPAVRQKERLGQNTMAGSTLHTLLQHSSIDHLHSWHLLPVWMEDSKNNKQSNGPFWVSCVPKFVSHTVMLMVY